MAKRSDARPNYSLRVTIAASIIFAVAIVFIVATPYWILSSWQYWAAEGFFLFAIWVIYELQPLPKPGRRRPRRYGNKGFGPEGTALLVLLAFSLIAVNRVNSSLATIAVYALFPGIMFGIVSIATLDYLIKGKNRYCQNCTEYRWFRPKHGSVYCTICGHEFHDSIPHESLEMAPRKLEPVGKHRIVRERQDISPLGTKPPKCKKCKSLMQLTSVQAFSGKLGGVEVSFFDLPCYACPQGHTKKYPGPDFGTYLIEELTNLPTLEIKGKLRTSEICPNCKSAFEIAEQRSTFGLQLKLDGLNPFLVDVSMPSTTCPTCLNRFALLDQQMISDIADAVISAFKSVDLER